MHETVNVHVVNSVIDIKSSVELGVDVQVLNHKLSSII